NGERVLTTNRRLRSNILQDGLCHVRGSSIHSRRGVPSNPDRNHRQAAGQGNGQHRQGYHQLDKRESLFASALPVKSTGLCVHTVPLLPRTVGVRGGAVPTPDPPSG